MPTLADATLHQRVLADLVTLAQADLVALWRSLDPSDATATTAALKATLPDLVSSYGVVAASLAADFYEELRVEAEVRVPHATVLADLPSSERVLALAGWATGPLFSATPDADLALSRLAGGLQRQVAGVDRATIADNVDSDRAGATFARHASANACAWCAMLASRGPVYRSEATATGARYHDSCHCVAVPSWSGEDYQPAPYVARWDRAYRDAVKATTSSGQPIDVTQVLAHMRGSLHTN